MSDIKEIIRIAGGVAGIIVGAGFASGQEIIQFFTSFGIYGFVGVIISTALFIFLGMALGALSQQDPSHSHKNVIYAICGKYIGIFVDLTVTFFMFALGVVMIAGGGALLEQLVGIPAIWGSAGITVITVGVLFLDVQKVINFISLMMPMLVVMVVIVAVTTIISAQPDVEMLETVVTALPRSADHWFVSALLYASFNFIVGTPFLIIMSGQTSNRKVAAWGGILGGVLLGVLMMLIAGSMYARADMLVDVPMPMLLLASQMSPAIGIFMSIVIFAMILNTAVGVLYSFSVRVLEPGTKMFHFGIVIIGLLAFACSMIGFVELVGTVYPFFGYLGFALMAAVIIGWFRMKKTA